MLTEPYWRVRNFGEDVIRLRRQTDGLRARIAEHGLTLLRVSIGLVFFWFGFLKFWPDLSP